MASSVPTTDDRPSDDRPRAGSPGSAGAPASAPGAGSAVGRAAAEGHARRTLLFEVGGRTYGCFIDTVREIIPFRRCTRLPGAPSFVCGLINLRGTIVTVLDLARRLDVGEVDRVEGSIVLAELGTKVVGVGVDRVRDVQPVSPDAIEVASGDDARGGIVHGLVHLDGEVVVLLDMAQVVRQVLQ